MINEYELITICKEWNVNDSFKDALLSAYNAFSKHIMMDLTFFKYDPSEYGFADLELVSKEYVIQKYFEPRLEAYVRKYLVTDFFVRVLEERGYSVYSPLQNDIGEQETDKDSFSSAQAHEASVGFEFVISDEKELIGCRLTDIDPSDALKWLKSRTITKIIVIDWQKITGISKEEEERRTHGLQDRITIMGIREFVDKWLGVSECRVYEVFMRTAIQNYRETIGINSYLKLTPAVLFGFRLDEETKIRDYFITIKQKLVNTNEKKNNVSHTLKNIDEIVKNVLPTIRHWGLSGYEVVDYNNYNTEGDKKHSKDIEERSEQLLLTSGIIETYYKDHYFKALTGRANYAKSFLTSEYLYSQYDESVVFDYTAIVCGYLKSVEQLMEIIVFRFIDSSINGKPRFFKSHKGEKIEFITENSAKFNITIGSLIYFIDHNKDIMIVNEEAKKVIIDCLHCYRIECRNESFHQHNNYDWMRVTIIRHNTLLLHMMLMCAFQLGSKDETNERLGIVLDDSLERLYFWLRKNQAYSLVIQPKAEDAFFPVTRKPEEVFPSFDEFGLLQDDFRIQLYGANKKGENNPFYTISRNNIPNVVKNASFVGGGPTVEWTSEYM
jgi:hypothetical protein